MRTFCSKNAVGALSSACLPFEILSFPQEPEPSNSLKPHTTPVVYLQHAYDFSRSYSCLFNRRTCLTGQELAVFGTAISDMEHVHTGTKTRSSSQSCMRYTFRSHLCLPVFIIFSGFLVTLYGCMPCMKWKPTADPSFD